MEYLRIQIHCNHILLIHPYQLQALRLDESFQTIYLVSSIQPVQLHLHFRFSLPFVIIPLHLQRRFLFMLRR